MTHTLLHFILNLIIIGCNLGLIVCILIVITFDYSHFDILNANILNWNLDLIEEIVVAPAYETKNEYTHLFNYTFPGTERGCDCSNLYVPPGTTPEYTWEGLITKGECISTQKKKECETIFEVSPMSTTVIFDNYSVMIKRAKNMNYFTLYKDNILPSCEEENLKDCGVIDTLGNKLCLNEKYDCPSSRLKINFLDNLEYFPDVKNYFKPLLETLSKNILQNIEFEFSTSDNICINQLESEKFGENFSYPLMPISLTINSLGKEKGCYTSLLNKKTIDERYTKILTTSISSIFSSDYLNKLKRLPNFPYESYKNSNLNLFTRGFIGWEKKCEKHFRKLEPLTNLKFHLRAYFTLFLINALIVLPYYLLFIMIVTQIDYANFKLHFMLSISHSLIVVLFCALIVYEYIGVFFIEKRLEEIGLKSCGDSITNNLFFSMLDDIRAISKGIFFSFLWLMVIFGCSLLKIVLIITKMKKRTILLTLMSSNNPSIQTQLISPVEIEMVTL